MKIAVIMTCFNRVETTLCCLNNLFACERPDDIYFDVWLVDDSSPDGTGLKIKTRYPEVNVIQGTGKLYWCGGMRLAWEVALRAKDYDAFLWLNDDTNLYADALRTFVDAASEATSRSGDAGIVVGATCDPLTKHTTYGVSGKTTRSPDGTLWPVCSETINGNAVWVTKKTWQLIGGLRGCFTHAMGDTDYGMRALKKKIPVWLTPVYIGTCRMNQGPRWDDSRLSLYKRWNLLHSLKGCPPWEYVQLVRVTRPWMWPKYVLKLYWRVFFPRSPSDDK
jgi:GT2 family glycosyltransferase